MPPFFTPGLRPASIAIAAAWSLFACGGPSMASEPADDERATGGSTGVELAAAGSSVSAVSLIAPAATLSGVVTLRAEIAGHARWVDFLVDGAVAGSASAGALSYALDVSRLAAGAHRLEVAAFDDDFRRSVSPPVAVRTSDRPPEHLVATAAELVTALGALGSAGGSIALGPGTYLLAAPLAIGANVFLSGAGAGVTILRPLAPRPQQALLQLAGSGSTVRNLSIDYDGGTWNAIELPAPSVEHVLLQSLELRGLSAARSAIELWGAAHRDISVQDCRMDGGKGGSAGLRDSMFDDESSDDSAFRNTVRGFTGFGIAFPAFAGRPRTGARNLAVLNDVSDIANPVDQDGRSEAAIWLGGQDNVAWGNTCARAAWELIWTGSNCLRCRVENNVLSGSRTGIYLEHSSDDSVVRGNRISAVDTGVNAEWTYGGAGTRRVRLLGNDIRASKTGVSIETLDDGFVLEDNTIRAGAVAVRLSGAGYTAIRHNDLRPADPGRPVACIVERPSKRDDGVLVAADHTTVADNDCRGAVKGVIAREGASGAHDRVSKNRWP